MGWRPKGTTPTRLPRRNTGHNHECANCDPSCTAGEVLHRRGHCGRCSCDGFIEKKNHFAAVTMQQALQSAIRRKSVGARPIP